MKLRTIIIDDERPNRKALQTHLQRHCAAQLEVVGEAADADEAFALIAQLKPDLIFLDIKMPGKSGFDLLRMYPEINFDIIFVSAFDEYAIQAFEFNTVDYILKPVDYLKLISAVNKAVKRHGENKRRDHLIHFVSSIDEHTQLVKKILIHHNDKVHIVHLNAIRYIRAYSNYCEIITDTYKLTSAKSLGDYEQLLEPFSHFLRISKSMIINANQVEKYTKGQSCFITLKGIEEEFEVSRRKKAAIIQALREE
jgi:two-component system LytT family response regulator